MPDEWISFRQLKNMKTVSKKKRRRHCSVLLASQPSPDLHLHRHVHVIPTKSASISPSETSSVSPRIKPSVVTPGGFDLLNNRWNEQQILQESSQDRILEEYEEPKIETPAEIMRKRLKAWEKKCQRRRLSSNLRIETLHDEEDDDSCICKYTCKLFLIPLQY